MYLTIHLALFAGALVLLAWKLYTRPPLDRKRLPFRPAPGPRVPRAGGGGRACRPLNRISRYLG